MFGEKLEELIKSKKIKSKDLAIASDVTEGYLTDIKKGRAIPKEEKLKRIVSALELNSEEKEEICFLWEKETSAKQFVKRFEELEKENHFLKKMIDPKKGVDLLEIRKGYEDKIRKMQEENDELQKYKTLLFLLPKDDRIFFVKKILKDIENNLKIKGQTRMLSKELQEIKQILKLL